MRYTFFLIAIFCISNCFAADTTGLSSYTNKVINIFNNCSRLDDQVQGAIKAKDPQAIDNARLQLLNYTAAANKELKAIGSFQQDASLNFTCRDVLKFYTQLAESDLIQIRDFFIVEQNFSSIKNTFKQVPVRKRTAQEIIAYNSEVKKYNDALTRYNQLSDFIARSRKLTLYNWNTSLKLFIDTHTNGYKSPK